MRLLRSFSSQLEDQLRLMARFLASKDLAVDWTSLGVLVLARQPEVRKRIALRLAGDYYSAHIDSERPKSSH